MRLLGRCLTDDRLVMPVVGFVAIFAWLATGIIPLLVAGLCITAVSLLVPCFPAASSPSPRWAETVARHAGSGCPNPVPCPKTALPRVYWCDHHRGPPRKDATPITNQYGTMSAREYADRQDHHARTHRAMRDEMAEVKAMRAEIAAMYAVPPAITPNEARAWAGHPVFTDSDTVMAMLAPGERVLS